MYKGWGRVIRINVRDVAIILKGFWEFKNIGVMDVFEPTRDGLFNSLHYAVKIGYMDEQTSEQYLQALLDTEKMDLSNGKKVNPRNIVSISNNEHAMNEMFLDVLDYSYRFWTDFEENNSNNLSTNDEEEPDYDYDRLFEKIAGYGTDALYTIMGIILIPLSVPVAIVMLLVSTTASIAMECWMGDFLDWLDQYNL